jgi:hypothetical protein
MELGARGVKGIQDRLEGFLDLQRGVTLRSEVRLRLGAVAFHRHSS